MSPEAALQRRRAAQAASEGSAFDRWIGRLLARMVCSGGRVGGLLIDTGQCETADLLVRWHRPLVGWLSEHATAEDLRARLVARAATLSAHVHQRAGEAVPAAKSGGSRSSRAPRGRSIPSPRGPRASRATRAGAAGRRRMRYPPPW